MKIFSMLKIAVELGASDIHITTDCEPIARTKGKFVKLSDKLLTKEDTEEMAKELAGPKNFERLKK